jgi:hypothetical protein
MDDQQRNLRKNLEQESSGFKEDLNKSQGSGTKDMRAGSDGGGMTYDKEFNRSTFSQQTEGSLHETLS